MFYNILLMAGRGNRFKVAGYSKPKALLKYKKKPMFQSSMEQFPDCDKWIFAVNKEIYLNEEFIKFLNDFKESYELVSFDNTTNGQATTCMESLNFISDEDSFFVGACDTILDKKVTQENLAAADSVVMVSQPTEFQLNNSSNFGWIVKNRNKLKVYCKEQVPNKFTDPKVILGFFYFSSKTNYKAAYEKMLHDKMFINDELYIDVLLQNMIDNHLVLKTLETNSIVLGTPSEYEENYE